jgi:hypothetical protein
MKRILFIIIAFILIDLSIIYPQAAQLIEYLKDENVLVRRRALEIICRGNHTQYLNEVINNMSNESNGEVLSDYLLTLHCLGHHDITLVHDFIDKIDDLFPDSPLEKNRKRVIASYLLLEYDDTSGVENLLESINNSITDIKFHQLKSLKLMFNKTPDRRDQVKEVLENIVRYTLHGGYRNIALNYLYTEFGTGSTNFIIDVLQNNSDFAIKMSSADLLVEMKYPGGNALFKNRLLVDPDREFRLDLVEILLKDYGEPSDLKFVLDYIPSETEPISVKLMKLNISDFKPQHLENQTYELITKLLNYPDILLDYEWIADTNMRDKYLSLAEQIQIYYKEENFHSLCESLDEFISEVQYDYSEKYLSKEGYKFLYYTAVYVKEDVITLSGECF